MAAYNNAPDKQAAFTMLASRLLSQSNRATLSQLITTHLSGYPSDPWPYYYQAKLQEADKNFRRRRRRVRQGHVA